MKKVLLVVFCLLMALFFLPGGMASWGDNLRIEGGVGVVEPEPEPEPETVPGPAPESEPESAPAPKSYLITVTISGQGTTIPAAGTHGYGNGTAVKLQASPAGGWQFDRWIIDGSENTNSAVNITIKGDMQLKAIFTEIPKAEPELELEPEPEEQTDDNGENNGNDFE